LGDPAQLGLSQLFERSGVSELALQHFNGALQRITSLGQPAGKRRTGMNSSPVLLDLDPAFELMGGFFEVGNCGFHLRGPTLGDFDTCVVHAIEPLNNSSPVTLPSVILSQRVGPKSRFALDLYHVSTPLLSVGGCPPKSKNIAKSEKQSVHPSLTRPHHRRACPGSSPFA
jgi:hypothetical protein